MGGASTDLDEPLPMSHFADVDWKRRPTAGIKPTHISVVNCFLGWEVTNAHGKEILTWSGATEFYWEDHRLIGYPTSEGVPEGIWRPKPMGNRGFDLGEVEKGKKLPSFQSGSGKVSKQGKLKLVCPFKIGGGGTNLSEQLTRFRAFPFDSLRVDNSMVMTNMTTEGDKAPYYNIQFDRPNVKNRVDDGVYQHVDWTACRHSDDYDLVCFGYAVTKNHEDWNGPPGTFCGIAYSLHIARTPNFYVRKGIVPLYLVSLFGLFTFFLEPADLPARCSVLSALFLTVYAIQWVTIERLPRLPFNTVLDSVAESVVGILIFNLAGMCVAFRAGRPEEGCFGDCLNFDIDAAQVWDTRFAAISTILVLGYSVMYQVVYQSWKISKKSGWTRTWPNGPTLFNKRMRVYDQGFRLWTDEAFGEKHGKKFMGEGVLEPGETW
ncbi:hypothetical protein TL16_g10075 [Triparma laevis f. inornata]|uniref:Uncharacterized protein n=2 Tax=Triparma laevis TaxID=1534972 RepID=A0A9W7AX60_9STRA|nr:hypothetical protein TrLO_g9109 [Triparma laevis f. longispina]GMH84941.1 hypothetical protein TL16_g10075 [Triparma laevis f. inornata]